MRGNSTRTQHVSAGIKFSRRRVAEGRRKCNVEAKRSEGQVVILAGHEAQMEVKSEEREKHSGSQV